MYSAFGRSATTTPKGTLVVRVEIVDDRTAATVRFETYTGTLEEIQQAIAKDLQALSASETDATVSAAVVGKLLGSI